MRSWHILPTIVIAQFFCTSLWFAGNAIMPELVFKLGLDPADIGYITSAVQFGFIVGTLVYAVLTIADRFNASNVFFVSALLGAIFNLFIALETSFTWLLTFRFMTGFFLAGIYPVGMKIAADYYEKGLGKALSFLVGALVLGTALPHLIAGFDDSLKWKVVLYSTSALTIVGGLLIKFFVPEGPYRAKGEKPDFLALSRIFSDPNFRSAAFGYFGHMWELYAFWAFVPMIIQLRSPDILDHAISIQTFSIIGIGTLGCFVGGYLSERYGTRRMAAVFLALSGACCLFSPLIFYWSDSYFFITFMIFWGMVVIADSPLFSTLVAQQANPELKGTALTLVTCIGFAITIISIQLLSILLVNYDEKFIFIMLGLGPFFGLISLMKRQTISSSS